MLNQNWEQIAVAALKSFGFGLEWLLQYGVVPPFFSLLALDTWLAIAFPYSELALMMSVRSLERDC